MTFFFIVYILLHMGIGAEILGGDKSVSGAHFNGNNFVQEFPDLASCFKTYRKKCISLSTLLVISSCSV